MTAGAVQRPCSALGVHVQVTQELSAQHRVPLGELTQVLAPWGLTMMTAGLMLTPMGSADAPFTATLITCTGPCQFVKQCCIPRMSPLQQCKLHSAAMHVSSQASMHCELEGACLGDDVEADSGGGGAHGVLADEAGGVVEEGGGHAQGSDLAGVELDAALQRMSGLRVGALQAALYGLARAVGEHCHRRCATKL